MDQFVLTEILPKIGVVRGLGVSIDQLAVMLSALCGEAIIEARCSLYKQLMRREVSDTSEKQ